MDSSLRFQDGNFLRFSDAVEALGDERKATRAFVRGINRTGDTARTKTVRSLAKQIGLPQKKVRAYGSIKTTRARDKSLAYEINSTGRAIPLREFGAKQFGYGVRAKPWGTSQRFPGTFIFAGRPNSGKFVSKGDVFHRVSSASLPLERMFGPSVPVEMVKGSSAAAFQDGALALPERIRHEIGVMTRGVVT